MGTLARRAQFGMAQGSTEGEQRPALQHPAVDQGRTVSGDRPLWLLPDLTRFSIIVLTVGHQNGISHLGCVKCTGIFLSPFGSPKHREYYTCSNCLVNAVRVNVKYYFISSSTTSQKDLVRKLQIYRLLWQYFLTGIRYRNVSIYDIEFGAIEPNYS